MFISVLLDYDEVAVMRAFGPFETEAEAEDVARGFIIAMVHKGLWSTDVLNEDSDTYIGVEVLSLNKTWLDVIHEVEQ